MRLYLEFISVLSVTKQQLCFISAHHSLRSPVTTLTSTLVSVTPKTAICNYLDFSLCVSYAVISRFLVITLEKKAQETPAQMWKYMQTYFMDVGPAGRKP